MERGENMNEAMEKQVIERIEHAAWMGWRIRRYGYACLTLREVEALTYAVAVADMSDECSERGRLTYVATRMRIALSTAHEHLCLAERAMEYFEEHDIPFGWIKVGDFYRLDAPIQPEIFYKPAYPNKQHNSATLKVNEKIATSAIRETRGSSASGRLYTDIVDRRVHV